MDSAARADRNDHTVSSALPAALADDIYLLSWVILSAEGGTSIELQRSDR
ncbi:hypothetical protein ACFYO7_25560 [Nocardia salmonicida]